MPGVRLLLITDRGENMKTYKLALISIVIALLSCPAIAQTSAQTSNSASPAVVSAVAAVYPPLARSAGVSGDVFVNVEIDRGGKVTSGSAERAQPLLQRASEDAARRWLFAPASKGENKRRARLTFSFVLMPGKTPYDEAAPIFYPPYRIEIRTVEALAQQVVTPSK
jgi:TonB family protein